MRECQCCGFKSYSIIEVSLSKWDLYRREDLFFGMRRFFQRKIGQPFGTRKSFYLHTIKKWHAVLKRLSTPGVGNYHYNFAMQSLYTMRFKINADTFFSRWFLAPAILEIISFLKQLCPQIRKQLDLVDD